MRLEWLEFALLLIGPPAVLLRAGARVRWFVLGIASWACALVLKTAALAILYAVFESQKTRPLPLVAAHGAISALLELGMAALFLGRRGLPLRDVLAFGTGIGITEVLWVILEGSLELSESNAHTVGNIAAIVSGSFLLERAITLVGHVSSRLLVYSALRLRSATPALIALGLFTLVDGMAIYGGLAGWDWEDARVWAGFVLFLSGVGIIEAVVATRYARKVYTRAGE